MVREASHKSRAVAAMLRDLEHRSPSGRDFQWYYITPVQCYPRYALLLRDLTQCTAAYRPDLVHVLPKYMILMNDIEADSRSCSGASGRRSGSPSRAAASSARPPSASRSRGLARASSSSSGPRRRRGREEQGRYGPRGVRARRAAVRKRAPVRGLARLPDREEHSRAVRRLRREARVARGAGAAAAAAPAGAEVLRRELRPLDGARGRATSPRA